MTEPTGGERYSVCHQHISPGPSLSIVTKTLGEVETMLKEYKKNYF